MLLRHLRTAVVFLAALGAAAPATARAARPSQPEGGICEPPGWCRLDGTGEGSGGTGSPAAGVEGRPGSPSPAGGTAAHAGGGESAGTGQVALTPEEAVVRALRDHPAVRAASSGVEAAQARTRMVRSGLLPRLDLTQDYVRSNNPVFAFGSKLGQERFAASDFALESLNQPDPITNSATRLVFRMSLWDAGRTNIDRKAAALGVQAAELTGGRVREQVAFNAVRAVWDEALAAEMLAVAEASEKAAEAALEMTTRQEEEGMALASDRMQAAVRLAEVREMRVSAGRHLEVARAALREAVGASPEARLRSAVPGDLSWEPGGGADPYVEEAFRLRRDLRALERDLERAGMGESRARSTWLPEVGLGAQYEWNGQDLFGNDGNNWTVGASLRVPLFEGLETGARLEGARADTRRLQAEHDRLMEAVRLQVISAYAEAAAAAGRLEVSSSSVEQSEESLRIVRERYAEGMAVVLELLDAEAAMTRAMGNRVAARHDLAVSLAALDLAVGSGPGSEDLENDEVEP